MKPLIIYVNDNNEIKMSKAEFEKIIQNVWDDGYNEGIKGVSSITQTSKYYPITWSLSDSDSQIKDVSNTTNTNIIKKSPKGVWD